MKHCSRTVERMRDQHPLLMPLRKTAAGEQKSSEADAGRHLHCLNVRRLKSLKQRNRGKPPKKCIANKPSEN